jgi:hypothetical protein
MFKKLLLIFGLLISNYSFFSQTICINTTEQLVGSGNPALVDPWLSSDPSIASVDNNGLVLGISTGSAVITFKDEFGAATLFNISVENSLETTPFLVSAFATNNQILNFDQEIAGDFYYEPLTDIVYQTNPGVSISLHPSSVLPLGVSYSIVGNTLTISGTPYTDDPITNPITFSYSIVGSGTNSCTNFADGFPNSASNTADGNITLNPPCIHTISGGGDLTNLCPNMPFTFTFTIGGGATGASVSGDANISISGNTVTISGFVDQQFESFTVTTTGGTNCITASGSCSYTREFFINPYVFCSSDNSNQTVCVGQNINQIEFQGLWTLNMNSTLPAGLQFTGGFSNNLIITGTPSQVGTFNYSVAASDLCANMVFASGTITVLAAPPTPTITSDGSTTLCQGESVNLTSSSSSDNTWSTTSNAQTINVNSSGSYTVSVSNGTCSSTSDPFMVTVNPFPVISLGNIVNPTGCGSSDGEIEILGNDTGTLSWTGSSTGSILTSLPINISTFTAGTYDFIFDDGCVSNSINASLSEISSPAIPIISVNGSLTFCEGDSVILTSSIASNIEWSNFETSQSITVHNSGMYFVTTFENGCTATSSIIEIEMISLPNAPSITNSGFTSFCIGESVILTSNVSNGIVWSPSNETNESIVVTNSGDYFLTFTENGCSINSDTISIFVNDVFPLPPTISTNSDLSFCLGDSVILTSSELVGNTWSTGVNTQSITVTNSGVYDVSINVNGCVATSLPISITVSPIPETPIITANGPTTFCSGNSVSLNSSSSNITWSSGETTPSINVTSSGIYSVTVEEMGCTATSLPIIVTVNQTPDTPLIIVEGSFVFCEGDSVVLSSNVSSNLEWSTGQISPSISVSSTQNITVSTTINGCTSTSNTLNVVENLNPNVSLSSLNDICNTDNIFTLSNGIPSGGYYEINNEGNFTDIFNPSDALIGINTITYTFIDENGCQGISNGSINVNNCLSLEEEFFQIFFYPNPSTGMLYLKTENHEMIKNIELHDELGRIIYVYKDIKEFNSIDLNEYANGIYTLIVKGDNFEQIQKINLFK